MTTRNRGRNNQYTHDELVNALYSVRSGMPVSIAANTYNIPRTTLRAKLKDDPKNIELKRVGPKCVLGEDIEKRLVQWIIETAERGFPIDKNGLLYSVERLVEESNIETPFHNKKPGRKWFDSFRKRNPIISQKKSEYVNKARALVTEEKIRQWFVDTKNLLADDINILEYPERIWNMDETAFFLSPKGSLVLAEKGKPVTDITTTSEKENITTLMVVNAKGVIAPPLTIFKYERLPKSVIQAAPAGWGIGKSDSGWMQSSTCYEYFSNIFDPYLTDNNITRPVIVFLDGHSSHLSIQLSRFCREKSIILVCLLPNSTHILQPLDVAFFFPLKSEWKKMYRQWIFEHNGEGIQKKDVPAVVNKILQRKNFVNAIQSGFATCGIFPFNADAVNYSKCITKKNQVHEGNSSITHLDGTRNIGLQSLETFIDGDVLKQFETTLHNEEWWAGNITYLELYNVWKRMKTSVEFTANNEDSINQVRDDLSEKSEDLTALIDKNDDFMEFDFPEFDNVAESGDMERVSKDSPKINIIQNVVVVPAATEMNKIRAVENEIHLERSDVPAVTEVNIQGIKNEIHFEKSDVPAITEKNKIDSVDNEIHFQRSDVLNEKISDEPNKSESGECSKTSEQYVSLNNREKEDVTIEIENSLTDSKNNVTNIPTMSQKKKQSVSDILDSIITWPEIKLSKTKRVKTELPCVLTSDKWLQIAEAKEREKHEKEEAQKAKKQQRLEKINATSKVVKRTTIVPVSSNDNVENISPNSLSIPKYEVGKYVLLQYDNLTYPAKILKVGKQQLFCSAMEKSGLDKWKWPDRPDRLWYPLQDILRLISPPKLSNSRGIYIVPDISYN